MRVMGFGDYLVKKWMETRDEVNEGIMAAKHQRQ
jgi:hypothetical protein